jgi:LysM repeat protein
VCNFAVRPYTVRKGDTLSTVCEKRGYDVRDVMALNYGLDADYIVEGQTILLPASNLSKRDKDILSGIGPKTYRTYPVRKGETIQDIIAPRKITMDEVEALNPEADLRHLAEHQVIKLPPNKYTLREREMLMGVAGAPSTFFTSADPVWAAGLIFVGVVSGVVGTQLWKRKKDHE